MGWRGTTRSLVAAGRRIDRANKRAAREQAAYTREVAKLEAEAQAEAAVAAFEELCDDLASVHCAEADPIKWSMIASAKEPRPDEPSNAEEYKARRALERYQPGFFDRLFKLDGKRRAKLEALIPVGVRLDREQNERAAHQFAQRLASWKASVELAKGVMAGEPTAERRALDENQERFSKADFLGRRVEFKRDETGWTIILHANPCEDMPQEKLTLLKSGKLSRKAMPKGELMSLHQDNVCGSAIRCAVEFFAIVPHAAVDVRVLLDMLDPASGHIRTEPIIVCTIQRDALAKVNLGRLDPSVFVERQDHRMKFMATKGFQKLETA